MNGTNVDYYVSGFDTAGKLVGSLICDFDPNKDKNAEKLAALKEKAKTLFTDAVVVDVISAADYNKYLTGEYVRGADCMPTAYIAPEPPVVKYTPTKSEKISYIKKYYDERFATLDKALVRRRLINSDITDLQEQYRKLNTEMLEKIKAVD